MGRPSNGSVRRLVLRGLRNGLLLAGAAAVLFGCVERELFIHTDPPAASLNLDGKECGETPVAVPFHYYGTRAVELRHPGYRVKRTFIRVTEPWYQYFPLDLVFDLLWPGTIRDNHVFFIELEPADSGEPVDRDGIFERAGALRRG